MNLIKIYIFILDVIIFILHYFFKKNYINSESTLNIYQKSVFSKNFFLFFSNF